MVKKETGSSGIGEKSASVVRAKREKERCFSPENKVMTLGEI